MSLPRYPKYRDSGVESLGEVPESWEVGIIRRYAQMKTGHTPSRQVPQYWENCTIPWFGLADVWQLRDGSQKYLGETRERLSEAGLKNSAAELLPAGTVVFSRTASVGYSGIMPIPMATTQDFWNWVCGPSLLPEYLLYLFRAMTPEFRRLTMGSTHKTIYQPDAAAIKICVPSLLEQRAIVGFIDRETARIDSLVAEQRRLAELLEEKRAAIISHAVTKGLNPDVSMKPSGVEWLGDMPTHWEIKRLRHVSPEITVGIVVEPSRYYVEEGVPALRSLNVRPGSIDLNNLVFISEDTNEQLFKSKLRAGDLVAVRSGQPGTTAVIPPELDGCNCIDLIIIRRPIAGSERFLCWFLGSNAAIVQFDVGSGGAIQQHFNIGTAKDLLVPVPPYDEQKTVAAFLDRESSRLDALVAEAECAIALLVERRAALISAAVTGKIDVRGLTAEAAA